MADSSTATIEKDNTAQAVALPDGQDAREANEQPEGESPKAVIAAVLANIAIGIVKFIAAAISGSSAMVSEGIHSIVDSGNGLLILFGVSGAKGLCHKYELTGNGVTVSQHPKAVQILCVRFRAEGYPLINIHFSLPTFKSFG